MGNGSLVKLPLPTKPGLGGWLKLLATAALIIALTQTDSEEESGLDNEEEELDSDVDLPPNAWLDYDTRMFEDFQCDGAEEVEDPYCNGPPPPRDVWSALNDHIWLLFAPWMDKLETSPHAILGLSGLTLLAPLCTLILVCWATQRHGIKMADVKKAEDESEEEDSDAASSLENDTADDDDVASSDDQTITDKERDLRHQTSMSEFLSDIDMRKEEGTTQEHDLNETIHLQNGNLI